MLPAIRMVLMAARKSFSPTYQLPSTESINSTAPEGETSDAQYIFNTDGTIQERKDNAVGGTTLSTSASSPWSDDPAEDGVGKYVRMTYLGGDADRRTDALGTGWLQLNSQRIFTFQESDTGGPYSYTPTYTVDISLDGSTVHDTQTLSVTLGNEGP